MARPAAVAAEGRCGRRRALIVPSALALQRRYADLETRPFIVAGTQDRYVDHRRQSVRLWVLAPQAELLLSPRSGHMVHHTDPRRVFHAIEAAAR